MYSAAPSGLVLCGSTVCRGLHPCLIAAAPSGGLPQSCNVTALMCGHRFFIENRPRSRAGSTFRPKIDLAHERGALSGKKQTSLMSEAYCMDCFNIPHMSAVHFYTLQCPPHRCAGHCLRCDRLSHDDFHPFFLESLERRIAGHYVLLYATCLYRWHGLVGGGAGKLYRHFAYNGTII